MIAAFDFYVQSPVPYGNWDCKNTAEYQRASYLPQTFDLENIPSGIDTDTI